MTYSPKFRGSVALGSSRALSSGYQNGSVSTITKGTPIGVNVFGQVSPVDVSSESSVLSMVGLMGVDTPPSANGNICDAGRLENITTSFNAGDPVWVAKGGGLTNVKPDIGVGGFASGDFVVFIGVIALNEFNALQKDIHLMKFIIGQL